MQKQEEKTYKQYSSQVLMIRPVRFGFNEQTADSNAFQHDDGALNAKQIQEKALLEFEMMVGTLREKGISVIVFDDQAQPHTPDSIFPNNWISFHSNGKVIIYPMASPNRRDEVRMDIPAKIMFEKGRDAQVFDLRQFAAPGQYLEGTGSMVLDREYQRCYACLSPRTDRGLFDRFCELLEVEGVLFHAVDENGVAIYHTNVMMALGSRYAVVCLEAIADEAERRHVMEKLKSSGHEVIPITFKQMNHFAGNMLEVANAQGKRFIVMSERAFQSLDESQIAKISTFAEPLVISLMLSKRMVAVACDV